MEDMFVIKVAEMYYKQGMSQIQISKKLNVSGTTISRKIEKAKEQGYVQIYINYPEGYDGEYIRELEEKFHLKEAIVVCDEKNVEKKISSAAVDYIFRIMKNNITIALGRGMTLRRIVERIEDDVRLKFMKVKGVKCLPLVGNSNLSISANKEERLAYSNFLIEEFARQFDTNSYQILAPEFVTTRELRDRLLVEPVIKDVLDLARKADVAIMSIGAMSMHNIPDEANIFKETTFERIHNCGGIGDLFAHIYDVNGKLIYSEIEDSLIGLTLEELKKIPVRVGIVCGMEKREAVLGALNGGYINVLITDKAIAEYLVENKEK